MPKLHNPDIICRGYKKARKLSFIALLGLIVRHKYQFFIQTILFQFQMVWRRCQELAATKIMQILWINGFCNISKWALNMARKILLEGKGRKRFGMCFFLYLFRLLFLFVLIYVMNKVLLSIGFGKLWKHMWFTVRFCSILINYD